jgi:hypothetical protein
MRLLIAGILLASSTLSMAQETAIVEAKATNQPPSVQTDTLPVRALAFIRPKNVKLLVKHQLKKAIDGKQCPTLNEWHPLTARQKLDVFVTHTYSPNTFLGAGIDALKFSTMGGGNSEYERGVMGAGQRYGINLATSETNVFFERFLFPAAFKQDPRYFRNPDLPFFKRTLYSISRVFIAQGDNGHQSFNTSKILGGAASQAIADLYVPGARQGLDPIVGRVTFNLVRDAGLNIVHEFWPDIHRGLLHRFSFIRNVSSRLD